MALARAGAGRFQDLGTGTLLWSIIAVVGIWWAIAITDKFIVGIVLGSIIALGALGLTLIYGVLKFAHFAHGDAMMLGAYIAFFALTGRIVGERADRDVELPWSVDHLRGATTPIWEFSFGYGLLLTIPVAAVAMALLFLVLDRLIYRPLRNRGSGIVIFAIASLGVALAIRATMLMFWGSTLRFYVKGIRPTSSFLGETVVNDQFFIFGVAVGLMALLYLLLFRTKLGKAMRAMADNPDLALISGINTQQIVMWTWAIGGALVAVAGVLLALQAQLKPELGFALILPLFAATILGGIGSPQGAFVGAMVVGVVQEVAVTPDFLSEGYKFSVAFVILVLVLLIRPTGLFGARG